MHSTKELFNWFMVAEAAERIAKALRLLDIPVFTTAGPEQSILLMLKSSQVQSALGILTEALFAVTDTRQVEESDLVILVVSPRLTREKSTALN